MQDQTIYDESQSKVIEATRTGKESPILVLLEGGDLKTRYKIDGPELALGRDVTCEIILGDPKSSRRHARILYHNFRQNAAVPQISIEDLGSTNGTFVNGSRITRVDLHDRDKVMIGSTIFGFFLRDETTHKADETLVKLASVDALTGLSNRGVFNLEIKREFDRGRRYKRPLTLVMFDIDHFKKFNDSFGHQAGDHVLRELGSLVTYNCRVNDLASRYGGEEFAVILPETALENATVHAERLRKAVMAHTFSSEATRLQVTISVGLAALEDWMDGPTALIEAADKALYQAKDSGRNQVCWYKSTPGQEQIEQAG